jgi:hypothetical protein
VVRETVLAVVDAAALREAGLWICADARLAAAKTKMAKDRFFTGFSISGGDKNYLIFVIIFVDVPWNEKNKK